MAVQWPSPNFGGGNLPDSMPQSTPVGPMKELAETTEFDLGPPQKRLIGRGQLEVVQFVLILKTDAVANELLDFHDVSLVYGVHTFEWEMPNKVGLRLFQFIERPVVIWQEADIWLGDVKLRVFPA